MNAISRMMKEHRVVPGKGKTTCRRRDREVVEVGNIVYTNSRIIHDSNGMAEAAAVHSLPRRSGCFGAQTIRFIGCRGSPMGVGPRNICSNCVLRAGVGLTASVEWESSL